MKVKELKNKIKSMTQEELKDKLKESKEELFHLRFQMATGHLDDTSKLRQLKRTVARVQTMISAAKLDITGQHGSTRTRAHVTKDRTVAEGRKRADAGTRNKKG